MKHFPVVRLHLWLEDDEGVLFGIGKAQLLAGIERHGSLNKAAREMGMSYRAAWGKIKQAEQAMGLQLVEKSGNCRDGCHLTDAGRMYKELFIRWFTAVEEAALNKAREIFPWPLRRYQEPEHSSAAASKDPQAKPARGKALRSGKS